MKLHNLHKYTKVVIWILIKFTGYYSWNFQTWQAVDFSYPVGVRDLYILASNELQFAGNVVDGVFDLASYLLLIVNALAFSLLFLALSKLQTQEKQKQNLSKCVLYSFASLFGMQRLIDINLCCFLPWNNLGEQLPRTLQFSGHGFGLGRAISALCFINSFLLRAYVSSSHHFKSHVVGSCHQDWHFGRFGWLYVCNYRLGQPVT